MSTFLILDFLLILNPHIIPCFFLLGFIKEKKISLFSIITACLLFDWIIYNTKYIFLLGILFLTILNLFLKRIKLNPYIQYLVLFISFFLFLKIISHQPFLVFVKLQNITTLIVSYILIFFIIKPKRFS